MDELNLKIFAYIISLILVAVPSLSANTFLCIKEQSIGFTPGDNGKGGSWKGTTETENEFNKYLEIRKPTSSDVEKLLNGENGQLFEEAFYPYIVVNPAVDFIVIGCKNGMSNGILICDSGKMELELIFNSRNMRFHFTTGRYQYLWGDQASASEGYSIGFCKKQD